MTITVLLIDAQPTYRKGLRALLAEQTDLRVVGETDDGHRAVELARERTPDVVVMAANISNGDSIGIVQNILASSPATKVMVLANHDEKSLVEDILRAGATGFMLRESEPDELIAGIRSVEQGNVALSSAVEEVVIEHFLDQLVVESPTGSIAIAANGILTTKLYRPRIAPNTVLRPRLLAQFKGWQKRPFTLVVAPAGYGKSIVLCQ